MEGSSFDMYVLSGRTHVVMSARDLTLPAAHRLVLVWLFQDLVQWLLQTDQIKTFRPRRI
jgi:hypothetical protein